MKTYVKEKQYNWLEDRIKKQRGSATILAQVIHYNENFWPSLIINWMRKQYSRSDYYFPVQYDPDLTSILLLPPLYDCCLKKIYSLNTFLLYVISVPEVLISCSSINLGPSWNSIQLFCNWENVLLYYFITPSNMVEELQKLVKFSNFHLNIYFIRYICINYIVH